MKALAGKKLSFAILGFMGASFIGTGLVYANAGDVQNLSEYVIYGKKDDVLQGGFARRNSNIALLGQKDVMDIPYSVTVIGPKAVDEFSAPTLPLDKLLVNNPAVRSAGSGLHNDFTYRGFRSNGTSSLVNGIPGLMTQFNAPTYMIDHVEMLNGPAGGFTGAAVQYESSATGGIVNYVTKRAGKKDRVTYKQFFSNKNTLGEYIDVSHRFGTDKSWGIRVNAGYLNGNTAISEQKDHMASVYVNLDQETARNSTNIFMGYSDNEVENGARWFKFDKAVTALPTPPKSSNNYGFKGMDKASYGYILGVNYRHIFNDKVDLFVNAGLNHNKLDVNVMPKNSAYTILNNNGDFKIEYQSGSTPQKTYFAQIGTDVKVKTGVVDHKFTFAIDSSWKNRDSAYGVKYPNPDAKNKYGTIGSGNIYNGMKQTTDPVSAYLLGKTARDKMYGWSLFDSMKVKKWDVMVGVHHQISDTTGYTNSTGKESNHAKASATSPNIGILYHANNHVAFYGSHSEYFASGRVVSSARANAGEILPPAKAKQNEIGVKYMGDNWYTTLAYFDISQANNIDVQKSVNGQNLTYTLQDGIDRHKGVEWTYNGRITDKWSAFGGAMYLNARKEKTSNGTQDGWRVSAQPKWSGVIGLEYAPNSKSSIIGRMTYFGDSIVRTSKPTPEGLTVPSYTVFDLGARYKTNIHGHNTTFTMMTYNLFNKNYWMASRGDQVYVSNPRTFTLTAQVDF